MCTFQGPNLGEETPLLPVKGEPHMVEERDRCRQTGRTKRKSCCRREGLLVFGGPGADTPRTAPQTNTTGGASVVTTSISRLCFSIALLYK